MSRPAEKLDVAAERLRRQILRGDYGVRGQLPPRSDLEKELGIPKSTMSQVILQLQGEGLVAFSGNRRLTAIMPKKRLPFTDKPFTEFLRNQNLEPVTKYVESPARLPMNETLAQAFNVEPGTLYVARIRLDGTKQLWYRMTSKYFLSSLIDDESLAGMQEDDRYDVIMDIKKKKGITHQFLTEETIARLPTNDEQRLLSIARSSPVLEITRTSYEQEGGRVLWFNTIVAVASLFVLHSEHRGGQMWKEGSKP